MGLSWAYKVLDKSKITVKLQKGVYNFVAKVAIMKERLA